MTLDDDIQTVREALVAHHAYHAPDDRRPKVPDPSLRHDDAACEVDDALVALDRITARLSEVEEERDRLREDVAALEARLDTEDDDAAALLNLRSGIELETIRRFLDQPMVAMQPRNLDALAALDQLIQALETIAGAP